VPALRGNLEELLRVTVTEPGAVWILRALHASPRLIHVRLASHRRVTDRLTDAYAPHLPCIDRAVLWRRLRVSVEIGFAVDVMLQEEDQIPIGAALRQTALMLQAEG
jgi:hypothetical protein